MSIVPKTLAIVSKFKDKLHTNDMYMIPKTVANSLKFMGEMTCTFSSLNFALILWEKALRLWDK